MAREEPGAQNKEKKKSAALRIHELEHELEPNWCCNLGLVPVTNSFIALMLCLLNVVSPGLGTLVSVMCAPSTDPVPSTKIKAERPEGFDESSEEEVKPAAAAQQLEDLIAQENDKDKNDPNGEQKDKKDAVSKVNTGPPVLALANMEIRQYTVVSVAGTALAQFLLAFLFGIGWIWSVSHGCTLIINARIYERMQRIKIGME